jgi:hypothetical protein
MPDVEYEVYATYASSKHDEVMRAGKKPMGPGGKKGGKRWQLFNFTSAAAATAAEKRLRKISGVKVTWQKVSDGKVVKSRKNPVNPVRLSPDIKPRDVKPPRRNSAPALSMPRPVRTRIQRRIAEEQRRQAARVRRGVWPEEHSVTPRHERAMARYVERHLENPGEPSPRAVSHYEEFHGVEPSAFDTGELWVPGDLVLLGECTEVNYQIIDPDSDKDLDQVYFHDHGPRVQVYKRCERGDSADLSYSSFPKDLVVLGSFPGLIVIDEDGNEREIQGSKQKLVAAPDRHRLVIVDNRGVLYLIKGGKLRIDDWIYD